MIASIASTAHIAPSSPAAPPSEESTRLSTSICRSRRARLAPSAVRTAISFWREAARASSRLATFADAISSTQPTARQQHHQRGAQLRRHEPVIERRRGGCPSPSPRDTAGRRGLATVSISACACSIVTPGRSRPTARIVWFNRFSRPGSIVERHPDVAVRQQRQRRAARCRRRCSRRRSASGCGRPAPGRRRSAASRALR